MPAEQPKDYDALLRKHVANLQLIFDDPNIWQKPPPTPEMTKAITAPEATQSLRKEPRNPRPPKTSTNDDFGSESESEMMHKNCTNSWVGPINHARPKSSKSAKKGQQTMNFSRAMGAETSIEAFKDLGLNVGAQALKREALVPWKFLVRYCELYVGKANTPTVEVYFDNEALVENQTWDFFYLYEPENLTEDPILFVPTCQLETLLHAINEKHGLLLKIPGGGNEDKFYRHFEGESTPRPRYLGRSSDAETHRKLLAAIPLPEPQDDLKNATQYERDEFVDFLKKIKDSWKGAKGFGRNKKIKNAVKRYESRKNWGRATKRVQRWLGLREKAASVRNYREFTGREKKPVEKIILDMNTPAPFDTEQDVVIVCFDIETYEKNPKLVTEIGFAVLDTKDLHGVAPGEGGENWFKLIKARHLRIKEYTYMRNHEYVQGCPEDFQFGISEIVSIDSILKAVEEIMMPKSPSGELRKVVVTGHDVNQDIDLILTVDFDVYDMPNLVEIVDNQRLQQHRTRLVNPQSLSSVLSTLDIPYFYLHNGGNDAVYTLQSLLRLAVMKRLESLATGPKIKPVPEAVSMDQGHEEGWSTGGEDSDGGCPPIRIDPNADWKTFEAMRIETENKNKTHDEDSAGW